MDGVEVVKSVKHLRPDVDVAVITGYGTIETAVETMAHGASDYVQKPFTEEELVEFARKLLIKREARLEAQRRPTVRIAAPATADTAAGHEYTIPGGAFLSPGHAWARIEPGGQVRIGLDDFARKALGEIDEVTPPALGATIRRGEALFTLRRGDRKVRFAAPLTGRILRVNEALATDPSRVAKSPYDRGWVCLIQPADLAGELSALRIGKPVADWYQEEIARWRRLAPARGSGPAPDPSAHGPDFEREFLAARLAETA
jgi:glycine cleavage system H lipoate-binding protein